MELLESPSLCKPEESSYEDQVAGDFDFFILKTGTRGLNLVHSVEIPHALCKEHTDSAKSKCH